MKSENTTTNVVQALKEAAGDLLSEETLTAIEASFNETVDTKVNELVTLQVEKALVEQDEDHAQKLEALLEAIDADHTKKLGRVVQAINENHAEKLKDVVKKYSTDVVEEAGEFKSDLVDRISNYLELYIENHIPTDDIKAAVENKDAQRQLSEMRKFLGVNAALSKASIKDAIKDGKKQIQESQTVSSQLLTENAELKTRLEDLERTNLLESLTKDLPTVKKKYVTRVLSSKTIDFIRENFDYTLDLFEKSEEEKIQKARQETAKAKPQVDRPEKSIVTEQADQAAASAPDNNQSNDPFGYMSELNKF